VPLTPDARRWSMLAVGLLPDEVKQDLARAFTAKFHDALPMPELIAAAKASDALLVTVNTALRAEAIASLPVSVKAIATYSAGYNHIDIEAARSRGIAVFYTPDVLTDAVAEIGMFLLLGAARRATESIDLIRSRAWPGWNAIQLNGVELLGKKLGILGMGRIGRAVAKRARAFGMTIHYHNRTRLTAELELGAAYHPSFDDMAPEIDALLIAAHSNPESRMFLNRQQIALLKPGSVVVNVGRGDLIEDEALIAGLRSGHVRAAGLDVFNNEPEIDERYFDLPNVFMLPHIGSSTVETRRRMGGVLIEGLLAFRNGGRPSNRIV
jgi:lactate dehydrogenase-like 2-hydroxyacid dehydrogenase